MPTKKQRRRRAKEQRHEYEVVYLDEEGNEVEVDPEADDEQSAPRRRRETRKDEPKSSGRAPGRGALQPPTWQRSARRSLIMAPFFFAFLYILQRDVAAALMVSLFYAAVFVPFSYGIDRLTYRTQLKRLERR